MPRNSVVTRAVGLASLVGTLGAGVWAAELHYATKTDVAEDRRVLHVEIRQTRLELRLEVLETRRVILEREQYELESLRIRTGWLTLLERRRLDEVKKLLEHLAEQILRLPAPATELEATPSG